MSTSREENIGLSIQFLLKKNKHKEGKKSKERDRNYWNSKQPYNREDQQSQMVFIWKD